MGHIADWYNGMDLAVICDCGHRAGRHNTNHCGIPGCACMKSSQVVSDSFHKKDKGMTADEKLDFIINWIHKQELEKMERDMS